MVDDQQRARALAGEGEAHFVAGRYDEASDAYRRAHALHATPLFLFAWARSEQEAGRCDHAIELYQQFLSTGPPPADTDRANLEVGRCYGQLPQGTEPPVEGEPDDTPVVEPEPEDEGEPLPRSAEREREPSAPWLRDPWAGAMLATGVTTLAVGAGLYLQARSDDRRARGASTTDEFRAATSRATRFSAGGIVGFSVGGALVAGAVIRYAIVGRRQSRVGVAAGPRSVTFSVRF